MKILHLPLKKEWYEMIESGVKLEEYREIKPYWSKRLLKDFPIYLRISLDMSIIANDFSVFKGKELHPVYTHVKFSYGYTKRTMTFEIESIRIGKGKPEWGAPTESVFIIKLGKRV
jgi:hypothetical protein